MTEASFVYRRKRRETPMRARRIGGMAHAAAGAAAGAEDFPGSTMPEPEDGRTRLISGAVSVLIHAGLIAALLIAVWLTPEEMVEELIEITRIEETAPEEPAPAPRVLAESSARFDPAPMAMAPQIVSPAVIQHATPVVNAERREIDTLSRVQAPREVTRAVTVVDQARAYQAVARATVSPVAIDAQAPAIRGKVDIHAPAAVLAGPRQVAVSGQTVGTAGPNALGTGSSVREGVASNRDVLGARTGVRAEVGWEVGNGLGRGPGGDGTGDRGGVTWEQCTARPEVQAYLGRIKSRVLSRWVLPPDVDANQATTLRFILDPAGTANQVDFVSSPSPALGESAAKAMRSASPFDQMSPRVRCLAGNPIQATFRNPSVATN